MGWRPSTSGDIVTFVLMRGRGTTTEIMHRIQEDETLVALWMALGPGFSAQNIRTRLLKLERRGWAVLDGNDWVLRKPKERAQWLAERREELEPPPDQLARIKAYAQEVECEVDWTLTEVEYYDRPEWDLRVVVHTRRGEAVVEHDACGRYPADDLWDWILEELGIV